MAKALHHSKRISEIYNNSSLPKAKSIKKIFFENPGLFFYVSECECLWEILWDVNFFRELMLCESIFSILSQFHLYPGVQCFYRDFASCKGKRSLVDRLMRDLSEMNVEAVVYGALNDSARKAARTSWGRNNSNNSFCDGDDEFECDSQRLPEPIKYSIPFQNCNTKITSCIIDGFSFSWLSSSAEYHEAGNVLHNCLKSWDRSRNPVVVVKKRSVSKAAIESVLTAVSCRLNGGTTVI